MSEQHSSEQDVATDGKLRRKFVMYTNGENPCIDRLGVMMAVISEMDPDERRAALTYAGDYYGFRVQPK